MSWTLFSSPVRMIRVERKDVRGCSRRRAKAKDTRGATEPGSASSLMWVERWRGSFLRMLTVPRQLVDERRLQGQGGNTVYILHYSREGCWRLLAFNLVLKSCGQESHIVVLSRPSCQPLVFITVCILTCVLFKHMQLTFGTALHFQSVRWLSEQLLLPLLHRHCRPTV